MRVLFCTSDKIGARAIRGVTWSDWSHVAIIDGDDVIEAVWPEVRCTLLAEVIASHSEHCIIDIPCPDDAAGIAWARAQIGAPYDLIGMLGLGLNRDWQDDTRWWCSEHATGALLAAGRQVFREGMMHRITPQHLWMLNFLFDTVNSGKTATKRPTT
jgi:hypothetical protein